MKWAVPVIVVALAACILAGSLGFQDTVRTTTEYDTVLSDLAPIADAGPVTESVQYNPLTNVTGWSSNVSFEYQTAASLYKLETDYEYTNGTSDTIGTMGTYAEEPTLNPLGYATWEWSDGSDVTPNAPADAIGGWSGSKTEADSRPTYLALQAKSDIHVTLYSGGEYQFSYFKSLTAADLPDRTIVSVSNYGGSGSALAVATWWPGTSTYVYSSFRDGPYGSYVSHYNLDWNAGNVEAVDNGDYILDGGLWYHVAGYNSAGGPNVERSATYNIVFVSNDLNATFDYRVVSNSETYYSKPYTPAKLNTATVSTWSNGYSNTTVKILADAKGLLFSINDYMLPDEGLEDTQDSAYLTWQDNYTGKILITLNADGNSYWQGVTSYSNTKEFTVSEYRYELLPPYHVAEPINELSIYYYISGVHEFAIIETWIPQDPNNLLWDNATFPIDTLFPTLWNGDNLRVKFNSFVKTGAGITINGVTYPVVDGNVTIDDDTFKLAGSALEWTAEGDTTLEAPNGSRYDLGTRSGTFTLNGVWYGVLSLDTFEEVSTPAKEAVYGLFPAVDWLAWVFVGVLAVGTVGVLATGRELDIMDILALALVGIAGVAVAVI